MDLNIPEHKQDDQIGVSPQDALKRCESGVKYDSKTCLLGWRPSQYVEAIAIKLLGGCHHYRLDAIPIRLRPSLLGGCHHN